MHLEISLPCVPIKIPHPNKATANTNTNNMPSISHLPPLALHVAYPKDYPSYPFL